MLHLGTTAWSFGWRKKKLRLKTCLNRLCYQRLNVSSEDWRESTSLSDRSCFALECDFKNHIEAKVKDDDIQFIKAPRNHPQLLVLVRITTMDNSLQINVNIFSINEVVERWINKTLCLQKSPGSRLFLHGSSTVMIDVDADLYNKKLYSRTPAFLI